MKRSGLFILAQPWLYCLVSLCICQVVNCAPQLTFSHDYFTRFNRLTTKEGLSSDKVLNIIQDRYGIMWFATTNGLTKFDGTHFTIYRHEPDNPSSLSCNEVTSLSEDISGHLWIGTKNGLNLYNRTDNTFTSYYTNPLSNDGIRNNHVKALHADHFNFLWIETAEGFLSKLSLKTMQWEHFKHSSGTQEGDYYYWHIFEDSNHDLWIGGRAIYAFLFSRNEKRISWIPMQDKTAIATEGSCFVETKDQKLLTLNCNSLGQYNPAKKRFDSLGNIPFEATTAVLDDKKNIWIGGSGGVLRLDANLSNGVVFQNTPEDKFSLVSDKVYCLYKSSDGVIWIGTDGGVSLYSENINQFRYYRERSDKNNSLSSEKITALMQDRDGLLWIGTEDNGVDTLSLRTEKVGNLVYNLLTKELDYTTFCHERNTLKQYARHKVIKLFNDSLVREDIFDSYEKFKKTNLKFKLSGENNVSALYQDKRGMIYVGLWSHVGFNIYDKKNNTFKRNALWSKEANWQYPVLFDGNLFGSNWYAGFLEDSYSRFWCATWEGVGLNLFDRAKGEFLGKHYMPANIPRYPKGEVQKMLVDSYSKRIFLGSKVYYGYYDFETDVFKRFGEILPIDYPNRDIINQYYKYCKAELIQWPMYFPLISMLGDGQGRIWLISKNQILRHNLINNDIKLIYQSGKEDMSAWLVGRDKNSIYIGQGDQLILLSMQNNTTYSHLLYVGKLIEGQRITALYEDEHRQLWIGTDKCLWVYHLDEKTIENIPFPDSQGRVGITTITGDYFGRIFVGYMKGVAFLKNRKIIDECQFKFLEKKGIPGDVVQELYLEEKDKLWICTNDGLVCWMKNSRKKLAIFRHDEQNPYSLLDNEVLAVAKGPDSLLWIGTSKGICIYHPETGHFEDKSRVGNDGLTSRLASCIMEDHNGNIWLGTTEKGLNVLHVKEDTIAHYTHHEWDKDGLPDDYIGCLLEDSQHRIWVGTNKGLCRYLPDKNGFERHKGLLDRQIRSIQEDKDRNLWIATDKGLYWLDTSAQIRRCFYEYHGLQGDNYNSASCRLADGRLAFGGNYGFNVFRPEILTGEVRAKSIVFSNFKVRDSERYADLNGIEQIRLSYQDNSFSIDFSAVDYEFGTHLLYRYRLLPFDRNWIYTRAPFQTAKYTNISSGDYTLEVEVSNCYDEWVGSLSSIPIFIATPWYRQWWFFGVLTVLLIGIVFWIIRYRERRLRKINIRLERLVSERTEKLKEMADSKTKFLRIISHDLKNSIIGLEKLSCSLDEQYGEFDDSYRRKSVSLFHKTSMKVRLFLEKLLAWGTVQNMTPCFEPVNLSKHVDTTFEHLQMMADEKEIQLINSITDDIYVDTDRNMLSAILQNLISNAIKYSWRKGRIVLSALNVDDLVEVRVTDQGIGMNEDRVRKLFRIDSKLQTSGTEKEQGTGLGLIIVYELIQQLKENVWVESQPERGTVFIFTLHKNIKN